jgi:CheY-like chemotaxis protein
MALVVAADDDRDIRALVTMMLEQAGHSVIPVADGPAAVAAVRRHRPDVVVVDGVMPGLDGVAVCRQLQADPDTADIPVVLVSGSLAASGGPIETPVPCVAAALTKPVRAGDLVAAVEEALHRTRSDPG